MYKEIGKLLINSFYGRLGMHSVAEKYYLSDDSASSWNDLKILKREERIKVINNVYVAAAITSKARIKLYRGLMSVRGAGGRILYTDTDSIIAAFPKNIKCTDIKFGEVIFKTNNPKTIIADAVFALPKAYSLKYPDNTFQTRIKGLHDLEITLEEFRHCFENNILLKKKVKQIIKNKFIVEEVTSTKVFDLRSYNKRIWCTSLKDTHPIDINNLNKFIRL